MQELNNGQGRENEHKDMSIDLAELDATIARLRERMEASKSVPANIDAVSVATKGKMIVAAIFMVISMCVLALSSYAWFTASTASNQNIIQAGIAGVEFVDLSYTEGESGSAGTELDPIRILPGYAEERELYAKNVGDVAVYVRAKVVATIVLEERYLSIEAVSAGIRFSNPETLNCLPYFGLCTHFPLTQTLSPADINGIVPTIVIISSSDVAISQIA